MYKIEVEESEYGNSVTVKKDGKDFLCFNFGPMTGSRGEAKEMAELLLIEGDDETTIGRWESE